MTDSHLPAIDPAMLELFQAEMDTHIPVLNEGLLALEKGQAGARQIEGMMRAAHSIKGAARIVGIDAAVRVAHVMEDCFTGAKEGRITLSSDSVDVLLAGVDALQRICSPGEGEPVAGTSLQGLLDRLELLKTGQAPATQTIPTTPATPAQSAPAQLIAATVQRDEPTVTLPAVFDRASCESLRKQFLDTLSLGPGCIELDFSQVSELPAGAIALLASLAREISGLASAPAIESRGVAASVRDVLRVAGLHGSLATDR